MENLSYNNSTAKEGFFQKPENILSTLFIGALILVGVYFFASLEDLFWKATSGLLGLTCLCGLGGLILWLTFGSTPRALYRSYYAIWVRKIWRALIEKSPAEFAQNYLDKLAEKKNIFLRSRDEVSGEHKALGREIQGNNEQIEEILGRAQSAKNSGRNPQEVGLLTSQAAILQDSNKRMIPKYQELGVMVTFLGKAAEAISQKLSLLQFQVNTQEKEYRRMKTVSKATNAARAILGAEDEERRRFDLSMQVMEESITTGIAEFENLMNTYEGVIANAEMDRAFIFEKGSNLLDRYIAGEKVNLDLLSLAKPQETLPPAIPVRGTVPQVIDAQVVSTTNTSKWKS